MTNVFHIPTRSFVVMALGFSALVFITPTAARAGMTRVRDLSSPRWFLFP